MKSKIYYILCIVFIHFFYSVLFISCSHDYKGALLEDEISEKIPNAVFVNFTEVSVQKGRTAFSIKGERSEIFDKKKLTVVKNLSFKEYDKESSVATEGKITEAGLYADTENIDLSGSFMIHSLQQGYYIEGESTKWNKQEKRLTADSDAEITIGKDDGSYIKGKGFYSHAPDKSFGFESGVEGYFVSKDDKDSEDNSADVKNSLKAESSMIDIDDNESEDMEQKHSFDRFKDSREVDK